MNVKMTYLLSLPILLLITSCQNNTTTDKETPITNFIQKVSAPLKTYTTFDRSSCVDRIQQKIENKEALVIHLMVPLCDNDNQGIVKVNSRLGDGMNLRTNLYWGSKYGVKNFFHKLSPWKLLESKKDMSGHILERIILYRKYPNGAKAYLVADAYRGDKMKACLVDYFAAISGNSKEILSVDDQSISIKSDADLIVFNGHNGLMDYDMDLVYNHDDKIRDAAVIGCASHSYFLEHLKHAKAYPLLMTTNLMAPEAYVAAALVDSWVQQYEEEQIKHEVGKAYHKYQQCGIKGATRLFKNGW